MRRRTTILLLMAVVLLGTYIWHVERKAETTEERDRRGRRVMQIDPDSILLVRMEFETNVVECAREGAGWLLRRPVSGRADAGEIRRILYDLSELPRGEIITAPDREARGLALGDYGLDRPRARITLGDSRVSRTLLIGRNAPLGGFLYVKEETGEDVIAVHEDLLDLVAVNVEGLRDRNLLPGEPARVRRLGLQRADGFVQLALNERGRWMIEQPLTARADRVRAMKLLDELFALRIRRFVTDAPGDAAACGLAEGERQVTIWSVGEDRGEVLLLGHAVEDDADLVYAKWTGEDSIYAIPASAVRLVETRANELRDQRLVPLAASDMACVRIEEGERALELRREPDGAWYIVEPRRAKADPERVRKLVSTWANMPIESFVDDHGTNLAALGFVPPARVLTFSARPADAASPAGPADDEVVRVSVSSMERGANRILVMLAGEGSFYEISETALDDISLDPLHLRDRTVLRLAAGDIRKIVLARGGAEQALERTDAGSAFVPVGGPPGVGASQEQLEELLATVSHLVASAFVAEDPKDLSPFGLDVPQAVITLGLSGAAGIGRTVLLGGAAPGDGRYGMVRGEDVVFVLSQAVADVLTRDLYTVMPNASEGSLDTGNDRTETP
ncbi:MAG: DUF4340 domain-containing protein [Kiritimatiellae bacterium]|nr:DUF4340 domain-containing protein [Kiritimatiellia bacterium]